MASSFNRVLILGNLGQDPELRYTPSQVPVVTLNVATTDYRQSQDGQKQEVTEWHRIVVWNKLAENCAKYLAKGRSVFVEGKLQTRSWDDKQTGQKRYSTEIIAQNVQFLGGGARDGLSAGASAPYGQSSTPSFGGPALNDQPSSHAAPSGPAVDFQNLDDIPF